MPKTKILRTNCLKRGCHPKSRTLVHNGCLNKNIEQKLDPFPDPINYFECQFLLASLTLERVSKYPWHRKVGIFLKPLLSPGMNHQICLANARYICDSYRGIIQRFLSISAGNIGQFLFNNPGMNHPIYCHSSWVKPLRIFHSSREKPTE